MSWFPIPPVPRAPLLDPAMERIIHEAIRSACGYDDVMKAAANPTDSIVVRTAIVGGKISFKVVYPFANPTQEGV